MRLKIATIKNAIYIFLLHGLISLAGISIASAQQSEEILKAAFIYNFISFVDWPEPASKGNQKKLLCYVGEAGPVLAYLREIVRRHDTKDGAVSIEQKNRDATIEPCHILYISDLNKADIDYLIGKSADLPVLVVSDTNNFVERGGMVGMFMDGNKVRLEINTTSLEKSRLVIDSDLMELVRQYP